MRSTMGVVVAVVLGIALATGTAIGVVSVAKQTPSNTSQVDRTSHPQILYGDR